MFFACFAIPISLISLFVSSPIPATLVQATHYFIDLVARRRNSLPLNNKALRRARRRACFETKWRQQDANGIFPGRAKGLGQRHTAETDELAGVAYAVFSLYGYSAAVPAENWAGELAKNQCALN